MRQITWLSEAEKVITEGTFSCMKAAYDAGINFFDCAEAYSGGESEKVMGEAIKKFGYVRPIPILAVYH